MDLSPAAIERAIALLDSPGMFLRCGEMLETADR